MHEDEPPRPARRLAQLPQRAFELRFLWAGISGAIFGKSDARAAATCEFGGGHTVRSAFTGSCIDRDKQAGGLQT